MAKIEYLSAPAQVSMTDYWFRISTTEHFWIRRRFEVLQKLAGDLIESSHDIAEIGCGHGLVQRQIEKTYGRTVTGFDLNDFALQQNQSQRSAVCCYDICDLAAQFEKRFDLILMLDVLEHINDEDRFLASAKFHLATDGSLIVNVPAGQWAYSKYDELAGHRRRYSVNMLRKVGERNGYRLADWTYWGFPMLPLAALRKLWVAGKDEESVISAGFDSRSDFLNRLLTYWSRCEPIPQKAVGTSLMAVLIPQTEKWNTFG